ncbi:MAG: hypothetical protein CL974_01555 [Euryarchaeota archaeon]|nr:hypothetical protein [Euryarchaeota archaeon]
MDDIVDNRRVWELVNQFESSRNRNNRLPADYVLGEAGNGWFQVWSILQKGLETQVQEPTSKKIIRNTTNSINDNDNSNTTNSSVMHDDNSTINSMQSNKTMNMSNMSTMSMKMSKSTPLANAISMLSVDEKNKLLGALNAAERSLIIGTPLEGQSEEDLQSKLGYGLNIDPDVESDLQSMATFNSFGTISTTTTNILPKTIGGKGINLNMNSNAIPTMINFNNNMADKDDSSTASVKSIFSSTTTKGKSKKSKVGNKIKVATKWEKFLPRETYERKDAAKGLASAALKKIGRSMSQVGLKVSMLGFKSGPLVGYAELRVRLKNDLGLELKMAEVDQLMRKFDPESCGKVEYEAILGCAKLLNDQRERRRKFNILMDQKKRNSKTSVLSMSLRTDDNAMDKLGAAAFDAAMSTDGKTSIEFSRTTGGIWEISKDNNNKNDKKKYQFISRDEFKKLLKDMHLGLTSSEAETLEKRYMDVQNGSINLIAFKGEFKRLGQSLMESVRQQGSVASFYTALGAPPQEVDSIIRGKTDKPSVLIGKTGAEIANAQGIATTTAMSTEGLRFMIDENVMNSMDKEEIKRLNQAIIDRSQVEPQSHQQLQQQLQQKQVESTNMTTTRTADAYATITPHGSINGPLSISIPTKDNASMSNVRVSGNMGMKLEIPAGSILEPLPSQLQSSSPPVSIAPAAMNPFAPRGAPLPPANLIKEQSPASSPDQKARIPMYHQAQQQESPLSSSMGRVAAATAASAPMHAPAPTSNVDPLDPFRNSETGTGITKQLKQPLYEMGEGKSRAAMTEKYIQKLDPLATDIDGSSSNNNSSHIGKTKSKNTSTNRTGNALDMLLLDPLATGMVVDEDGNAKKIKKVKSDKKGSAAALAAASEEDPFAHLRKPISSMTAIDMTSNTIPTTVTTSLSDARPLPAVNEIEEEGADNDVNNNVNDNNTGSNEQEKANIEEEIDVEAEADAAQVQELLAELEQDVARATTAEQRLEQGADPSDILAALLNSAPIAPPVPSPVALPSPVPPAVTNDTTSYEVADTVIEDEDKTAAPVPLIIDPKAETKVMTTDFKVDAPVPLIIDPKAETKVMTTDFSVDKRVEDSVDVNVDVEMDEDDAEEDEQASFDEAALLAEIEAEDNRLLALHGLGPTSASTSVTAPAFIDDSDNISTVEREVTVVAPLPSAEFEIEINEEVSVPAPTLEPVDINTDIVEKEKEMEIDMLNIAMHGHIENEVMNNESYIQPDDQLQQQHQEVEQQQGYGWYRYYNDGNAYYYNHDTGESSWEEPIEWTDGGKYSGNDGVEMTNEADNEQQIQYQEQEIVTNEVKTNIINTIESTNVPVPTDDQVPITIVNTTMVEDREGEEEDDDSINSSNNINGNSKSYHGLPTKKVATTNASKSYLSLANAKSPTSGDDYKIDPFRLNTPNKY